MVKVTVLIDGQEVEISEVRDVVMRNALAAKIQNIKEQLGHITDPETGVPPEITFHGSLEELRMTVKGSDAVKAEVIRRLEPQIERIEKRQD